MQRPHEETTSVATVEEESRRTQMLAAALDVIVERGFPDTRIADVAERAGVSPALVIYYFKTKDRLLADAMRHSEDVWYAEMLRRTEAISSAAGRLQEVVAMTCLPGGDARFQESWAVWLDLWAQALRDPDVRVVREEFDEHFRETIRQIIRDGIAGGEFREVDPDDFAVAYSAMLDGLAIQIALVDPVVDPERSFDLAMRVAAGELGFEWQSSAQRRSRARRSRRP
jgi:AcrR family transcriptional regulator